MSLGHYKSYLLDIFFREPKLVLRYYRPFLFHEKSKEAKLVFMADGKFPHGGMFDRLKGLISVYAASKVLNRPFKIFFCSPFSLRKYLEPNQYDWTIGGEELCYHYPSARPVFMYGEIENPRRIVKDRKCETHFYYGYDSLDYINSHFNVHFEWGSLYQELFRPTQYLQYFIDKYKAEIGMEYVVVHFRFLNLLGDKIEFDINPTLTGGGKQSLMEKALCEVKNVIKENPSKRIMLACDSNYFASYVKKRIPKIYTVPGEIKHVGTSKTSDEANVKMFIDYYLIAGAEKVYNFVGPGMWKSAFPEYAAKIGCSRFERKFFN